MSYKTHKRKNSHLFMQQNTSGSAVRSNFEVGGESLELEEMQASLGAMNSSTVSIAALPPSPKPGVDLEAQNLDEPTVQSSWSSRYLDKKFGNNKRGVAVMAMVVALLLVSFVVFFVPIISGVPYPLGTIHSLDVGGDNNDAETSQSNGGPVSSERRFTIEDVIKGEFFHPPKTFHFIEPPSRFEEQDMDPGLYLTVEEIDGERHFLARQLFDGEYNRDLGSNTFRYEDKDYLVETVKVSYYLTKMIFGTEIVQEFRESSLGHYWLKDVDTGKITPIRPAGFGDQLVELSYVYFSPCYNFIYFVHEGNLYVQNINGNYKPVQVTKDGDNINILNGKPDWVYEEEVLSDDKAVWWSPDDSKLVFVKFNDTDVEEYDMPMYISDGLDINYKKLRYPLPGQRNPKVELYLYNLQTGVLFSIGTGFSENDEFILYYASWIGPSKFMFKLADRYSKKLFVRVYDVEKGELITPYTVDTSSYNGWVEKSQDIFPMRPKAESGAFGYIDIQPDSSGFNHLFYYPDANYPNKIQLTKGEWEVTGAGVVGFDAEANILYFTANMVGTMSQHLYAADLSLKDPSHIIALQDPNLGEEYYEFEISSSGRYALMRYLGPAQPVVAAGPLQAVLSARSVEGNPEVLILSDNDKQRDAVEKFDMPITSYKTMLLDDGVEINFIEIKPAMMEPKKKYPLLVSVYGGPGSQTYSSSYSVMLEQAVASGLDAIILQIEPRGTGGKGWKFKSWAKQRLGYWEPRDVTEVTRKFIEINQDSIDTNNVAIWGWSYGGFVTLKTVEYDMGETFKYAVAVAPVTNWLYYDSIYTERYMDSPSLNKDGYNGISLIKDVDNFRNMTRFMLIHGTGDNNVHIRNTYELVDKLNLANIRNYDLHIFPDSDHSIRFHNAQPLVYKKIYYWLQDAFNGNLVHLSHK